jgi:hypothetical protein
MLLLLPLLLLLLLLCRWCVRHCPQGACLRPEKLQTAGLLLPGETS